MPVDRESAYLWRTHVHVGDVIEAPEEKDEQSHHKARNILHDDHLWLVDDQVSDPSEECLKPRIVPSYPFYILLGLSLKRQPPQARKARPRTADQTTHSKS